MSNIILQQKPIIKHDLEMVGLSIKERIEKLNLPKLVATEETVKSLKELRAELNKEHAAMKQQFKLATDPVSSVLNDVKQSFKENVDTQYDESDKLLKTVIGKHELKIKEEIHDEIKSYFDELCASEEIDFLKFTDVGLSITLSSSKKSYRDKCNDYVLKVKDDLSLIETDPYKVEIMVEYRKTRNASKAIKEVRDRKEAEKQEKARIQLQRTSSRVSSLRSMAMVGSDVAKAFYFVSDDTINVSAADVENMTDDEWLSTYEELKFNIDAYNEQHKPKTTATEPAPKPEQPLKAPEVVVSEKKEAIHTAAFEVQGTMSQLLALSNFLKSNNYEYKNI